ncbi:MAG: hypothetical protein HOP19_28950 [Acidobacteria bacterium]|nr:hypothetical protein [Acidobacteriota bacterium]
METKSVEKRYTEAEAAELKLFGIGCRITLHRWRKANRVSFYRVGNRVYYGESHVTEFWRRAERQAKGGRDQ